MGKGSVAHPAETRRREARKLREARLGRAAEQAVADIETGAASWLNSIIESIEH